MNVPLKFINFGGISKSPKEHIFMYLINSFKKEGVNLTTTTNDNDAKVILCSVFPQSLKQIQRYSKEKYFKILFVGENTKRHPYTIFDDVDILKKEFHVILSLSRCEDANCFRIPNWVYYYDFHLKEKSNMYNFIKFCIHNDWYTHLDMKSVEERIKGCSMVAKSDIGGRRTMFVNMCKENDIVVKSPSSLCNNDKPIGKKPIDKYNYIKQYVFNICPENSFNDGYCTEKLFQAIVSGCIPIYWGDPENETFFNKKRIIYCENAECNNFKNYVMYLKRLLNNPEELRQLYQEPLFHKNALIEIDKYIDKFDKIAQLYSKTFQ